MIIDLTVKLEPEMIEQWLSSEKPFLTASGHIGTHLDTCLKTTIPLEYFKRKGVFVDVSHIDNKRDIEINDIPTDIAENSFVLFYTGHIEKHAYGVPEYFQNHPQLSQALIQHLIHCKISFIGIDCSGVRRGKEHIQADTLCEENGIYIIENLCNLKQLISTKNDLTVYTMWLDDPKATGLKCKILVEAI